MSKRHSGAIKAKTYVMPSETDLYFPTEDSKNEVAHMPNAKLIPIPSVLGDFAGGPGTNPDDVKFLDAKLKEFARILSAERMEKRRLGNGRGRTVSDETGAEPSSAVGAFVISSEPYYRAVGDEIAVYEAAYSERLPVMLKGPTGCGKTRFLEHMAWRLRRPLITIAASEDMTAADLVGRYLLLSGETAWRDGPLTLAVREGAICYIDEIVEARQDTTVAIHPLTDARRVLPLEKRNEQIAAHPDFQLAISYNPGYQSAVKDLKEFN